MAHITVRLFGLGEGDAGRAETTWPLEPGATVHTVWASLRREARPGERLATLEASALLALVNGRPVRTRTEWLAPLADGDTLTLMPKAFGG